MKGKNVRDEGANLIIPNKGPFGRMRPLGRTDVENGKIFSSFEDLLEGANDTSFGRMKSHSGEWLLYLGEWFAEITADLFDIRSNRARHSGE